jgi:hypothetical protein
MKKISALLLALAVVAAGVPASALEWTTVGPQAMGMGGAGVANTQGPNASYWNPAALGRPTTNSYGITIPVDVEASIQGSVVQGAKDLQNAESNCQNNPATCTANVVSALGELNHADEGLNIDGGAGGNLKIGKLTVFLHGFLAAGAEPFAIDAFHTSPVCPGPTCVQQNTSSLLVKGATIAELGAGYGHELPWVPGLYLGGDFKVMRADVGLSQFSIVNNGNANTNIVSTLKNNSTTSGNVGIDAGALWDVDRTFDGAMWQPKLGLTWRNINNPKFSQPGLNGQGTGMFAVNPQMRTGLSFSPLHWWHFAADADLTKNTTPLDGYDSQQIGAGTEIDVFNRTWINIPLRVGIKHNTAAPNDGQIYTLGTGVNLLHFMIDVAGETSNQKIQIQSSNGNGSTQNVPRYFGASIQLALLFGGSEEHRDHGSAADEAQPVSSDKVKADSAPSQSDVNRVKADSDKAHQELNNQAPPGY